MMVVLDIHIVRVFILTPKKKPGMLVKKVKAKQGQIFLASLQKMFKNFFLKNLVLSQRQMCGLELMIRIMKEHGSGKR